MGVDFSIKKKKFHKTSDVGRTANKKVNKKYDIELFR